MSGGKPTETAGASDSSSGTNANQKCQEAKAFHRIKMTSDGDAYVHLGSWAARKSNDTCGKQNQNISDSANAAKQRPAVKPAEKPAPTKNSFSDEDFVIINRSFNN